jgi:hypothetical protein
LRVYTKIYYAVLILVSVGMITMYENKALRIIFGIKKKEVAGWVERLNVKKVKLL